VLALFESSTPTIRHYRLAYSPLALRGVSEGADFDSIVRFRVFRAVRGVGDCRKIFLLYISKISRLKKVLEKR
jgi:hypothetical protein